MIEPPSTFPDLASSGIKVTSMAGSAAFLVIQRGTEADRIVTAYMEERLSHLKGIQPPKLPDLPPAVMRGLPTQGIFAMTAPDAAWLIFVGNNTPESQAIIDHLKRHGQMRPRKEP